MYPNVTFAYGTLLAYNSVGVHVCDVDGQVPTAAGHAAGHGHAQRVVRLLGQRNRLLVAGGLLARVLRDSQSINFRVTFDVIVLFFFLCVS